MCACADAECVKVASEALAQDLGGMAPGKQASEEVAAVEIASQRLSDCAREVAAHAPPSASARRPSP